MRNRIWIILIALLLCNAIGLAVLMANTEANAAGLAGEKASSKPALKAAVMPVTAAAFATIVVNTRKDEGNGFPTTSACSLREAINSAQTNTSVGGCTAGSSSVTDIIEINLPAPGGGEGPEINIEAVLPNITTNLNIVGDGPNVTIVQRSHAGGVGLFRVFNITSSATVTLSGMTVINGLGNMNGVGIQNAGNLTLDGMLVTGNNIEQDIATPTGNGGGIANSGTLTINNSDITNNRAGAGGGIHNAGTLTMTLCTIGGNVAVGNIGGGLANIGTVTMTRSVIKANIGDVAGGGVYNSSGGLLTMTNCSIGLNSSDGAGSAIYNEGNTPNSTINLRSVTIGKHANAIGDADHDAAIFIEADSVITYRNSIFSDYYDDGSNEFFNFNNQGGTLTSEGYNICNDSTATLGATGDFAASTDPKLDDAGLSTYGPVAENPDRIETFRLMCDSPAINAIPSGSPNGAPAADARNVARIGNYDIGSYEFNYQITTASALPNFTQGSPYSVTFAAQGGDTPYFWTLTSGSLPAGLDLDSITGVISGTPTASGNFTFTIQVEPDQQTYCATSKTFTLASTVTCGTITLPTNLNAATCDSAFSQQLTAAGGTPNYSFTLQAGSLPTGLTLTTGGLLSGTPTVVGTSNFTVRATDANSCQGSRAYSLTVNCPTITVGVPASSSATTGQAFSGTFTSSKAGATFSLASGTLPTGLSLSTAGVLSGTPTQSGSFPITVSATVGTCVGTSALYTLVVTCPTITLSATTLPNATCDSVYPNQTLTASGGSGAYSFMLQAGSSLPAGMTLSSGGVLGGTPTVVGSFSFTICATDANGCKGTRVYSLTVNCPTITVGVPASSSATTGQAFSGTFTSSKAGATFSLASGTLPTGLSLSTAGVLSGTPTQSGSFPITVSATVGTCVGTSALYTLVVACPTITLSATTLPNATCDSVYPNQTLTASGGSGAYSFMLQAGSSLPAGMTLSSGGVLGGTPTVVGSFSFTICATDANGCKGTRAYSLTVNCPTITVNPSNPTLSNGTVGTAYSQSFTSSKAGATFSTTSTLPTGLTLSGAGVLSGTPTQSGTFSIAVTATAGTCTGARTYSLTINCPTIALSPTTLANGTQGSAFSQQITATPGTLSYTYKVLSGALPSGVTLSNGGLLAGTPTVNGTFNFTVCATGTANCLGQQAYSWTIASNNTAPTITPATLSRQKGSPAGAAVTIATVSDGQTAAGSLTVTQIAGGTATGITVTGITNTNGTITAQVAASCTATAGTVRLQVSDGSLTTNGDLTVNLTNNTAPTLTYNTPDPVCYTMSATVNPATGPSDNGSISSIVLQSVSPSVPNGAITVNNSTGVVTINNTVPTGFYTVTVRATDNCNATTDASFTLNVIGTLLISEFRLSGPTNGQNNWYVELYNSTTTTINTTGLKLGLANQNGSQVVSYDLPTNLSIAARGYFLLVGSGYTLTGTPADFTAPALPAGFNPAGAGLFKGAVTDATKRVDTVGLNSIGAGATYLFYVEGTALPSLNNTLVEHAFVRKFSSTGVPTDTNNNLADFILVAPATTPINGVTPMPGAPGPQNNTSPLVYTTTLPVTLFNTSVSSGAVPNTFLENIPVTVGSAVYTRSLYLRRSVTNSTGAPVTKLRFRIVEMSNGGVNTAILRAIDSADITVNGQPVKALTLDVPPAQPTGGGVNSTLSAGSITLVTPLATSAKINVHFRLGIVQGGSYRFFVNVEAAN